METPLSVSYWTKNKDSCHKFSPWISYPLFWFYWTALQINGPTIYLLIFSLCWPPSNLNKVFVCVPRSWGWRGEGGGRGCVRGQVWRLWIQSAVTLSEEEVRGWRRILDSNHLMIIWPGENTAHSDIPHLTSHHTLHQYQSDRNWLEFLSDNRKRRGYWRFSKLNYDKNIISIWVAW